MTTSTRPSIHGQAAVAARTAAERADTEIRSVEGAESAREVSALLADIWATDRVRSPVPAELVRALTHSGGYTACALSGSDLVGASVGMFGLDADGLFLYSFITGVKEGFRSASVGFALKLHQRAWALERGIRRITWTFDPLVRRNAYFNLGKLGADATAFYPNFYGAMGDGLNAGDESDRILIEWTLDSPRAVEASHGLGRAAEFVAPDGLVPAWRLRVADDGTPEVLRDGTGPRQTYQVPRDVVALRRDDPELAHRWRVALRETLGAAMAEGRRAVGFTSDGCYVLQ